MTAVMAIGDRINNADLMADCERLGYIHGRVIDLTYGLGRFWNVVRPKLLITNDIDPERGADITLDFTDLSVIPDDEFDTAVFDPPYKLNGTSKPRGPAMSDESYGVAGDYMPMGRRHQLMCDGLIEAIRITKPRGHVLVKCQDQVSSGSVRWQTDMLTEVGHEHGARKIDMLHVRGYREQPKGRSQRHARRDYSTLIVFEVTP